MIPLSGCGKKTDGAGDTSSDAGTEAGEVYSVNVADPEHRYKIILPDEPNEAQSSAARTVKAAIAQKTGFSAEFSSDMIYESLGLVETPYEIIVGNCCREESRSICAGLLYHDYEISIAGTKLCICGGSDEALLEAADRFAGEVMTDDGRFEGNVLLRYDRDYPVKSVTVNGKDLFSYTVICPTTKKVTYEASINLINSRLAALTGHTLKTGTNPAGTEGAGTVEFGDCGTALSSGISASGMNYASRYSDGSIAFVCQNGIAALKKVLETLDKYLPENSAGNIAVTLENGEASGKIELGSGLCPGANLRVMTNNVLSAESALVQLLAEVYLGYCPDIIGMQECGSSAQSRILGKIGDMYGCVCGKIGDSSNTGYTPVFYNKERFSVLESRSELFDSRWPKTNTKTYSWAVFEDKTTGKKLAVINAHWAIITSTYDTVAEFGVKKTDSVDGKLWREDNSRQVLEKKDELRTKYGQDLTVIVMGDMNASTSAQSVTVLGKTMVNCLDAATVSRTSGINSYHKSVGKAPEAGSPIDNIFVTGDTVKVYTHEIVSSDKAVNSSDHCPVVADLYY